VHVGTICSDDMCPPSVYVTFPGLHYLFTTESG